MKTFLIWFCLWREHRAMNAEAKWANRRYWLVSPEWRRASR